MNAKEILQKAKALFSAVEVAPAPVAPAAPAAFESYNVDGGEPAYTSGAIAQGSPVFADEAMTMPYPDGTFTVSGTSFTFTVAGGIVSATTGDINATVAPAVAAPPALQPAPQITALEDQLKELKEQNVKLSAALEVANTLIQKHEKTIPALFELCEELAKEPTTDPVTLTGRKKEVFERANKKDERISNIAQNLKNIRKNQN